MGSCAIDAIAMYTYRHRYWFDLLRFLCVSLWIASNAVNCIITGFQCYTLLEILPWLLSHPLILSIVWLIILNIFSLLTHFITSKQHPRESIRTNIKFILRFKKIILNSALWLNIYYCDIDNICDCITLQTGFGCMPISRIIHKRMTH